MRSHQARLGSTTPWSPLLCLVLLVGLLSLPAVRALAATGSTIVGVPSGRCLDVQGASHQTGARVMIYRCHGTDNQAWTLTAAGELRVYASPKCLDVKGADTTSPAKLQIASCSGAPNQQFTAHRDGTITGVQSGLCLDVQGGKKSNSTPVELYRCNGRANQTWKSTLSTDTTPPSVPADARTRDLTCATVTLAWDASTDDVGVAFYDIFHDGQLISTVSGSTLSAELAVVAGATWGLYVDARDAAGNVSQSSDTVTITPPACQPDHTPPTPPADLRVDVSGTAVTLSWTAATDDVGVRAYAVYRDDVVVGAVTGTAAAPPAPTFRDSGLAPRTTYRYRVVARDAQDNASDPSNTVAATTGASCANPICKVTKVATDTDIPWGLLTLPDGTVLYSRRDAHDIVHLDPTSGAKTTVGVVPNVAGTDGEGGLLGLAVAPTFASDHWLYVMHTSPRDSGNDNRVVRIKLVGDHLDLSSEQVLVTGILRNKYHNGGRLRFGPDGKLYASTGDAQNGDNAQNKNGLNGKILRLNPDGTVPSDNPYGNLVWSYGHRNPQGLAFDAQGRLWEQEFGNTEMDETNLIVKGGNYGWPACEGTTGSCDKPGFVAPKHTYPTSAGSCSGIAIVRDALYVACQRGTRMYREEISGSSLTDVQSYFNGTYGRLRTVEPAADGGLWLTTTNQGDKDSTPNNSKEQVLHVDLGQ